MQSWLAFLCALQLALLSASAFAQDFNDLQKAAEQDDVQAQNILGVHYHDGRAVPQDDTQWFRKAAHQGCECAIQSQFDVRTASSRFR